MKCPRCGFTQPKDQYCAQCGVDMMAFKPPPKPWWERALRSVWVQVGFIAMIVFVVASTVIKKEKRSQEDRISYLRGHLQISSTQKDKARNEDFSNSAASNTANSETATLESAPKSLESDSLELKGQSSPASVAVGGTSTLKGEVREIRDGRETHMGSRTLRITHYEMTQRVFDLMMEESQKSGQFNNFGDYSAGLITQFSRRLKSFGKEVEVLLSETKKLELNQPQHWFLGLQGHTAENHLGLSPEIELQEMEPEIYRLNFEVVKSWREPAETAGATPSIQKRSYPLQIDLNSQSAAFMSDLLMIRSPMQNEEYLSSIPPFQVFKIPRFRQGQSRYVIVLEFEK